MSCPRVFTLRGLSAFAMKGLVVVLLLAVAAKTHQSLTAQDSPHLTFARSAAYFGLNRSSSLVIGMVLHALSVPLECMLLIAFLARRSSSLLPLVLSLLFFAVAALLNFAAIRSGEASCGCFGSVPISPYFALGLNLLLLLLIIIHILLSIAGPVPLFHKGMQPSAMQQTVVWPIICTLVAAAGLHVSHLPILHKGLAFTDTREVATGQPITILGSISIDANLLDGPWTVMVVRPDCDTCAAALSRFGRMRGARDPSRYAVLSLSGQVESAVVRRRVDAVGVLDLDSRLFLRTPTVLSVVGGRILAIDQGHL